MKNSNVFNYIVTLILIPLWRDFVKELIKQIPWLYYTVSPEETDEKPISNFFC